MTPVYLFPPHIRRQPGYSTNPRQRVAGPHHLHVVYQQGAPSSSRRGESPMVPGPDCMEDGRMCPNGIHHAALGLYFLRLAKHSQFIPLQNVVYFITLPFFGS